MKQNHPLLLTSILLLCFSIASPFQAHAWQLQGSEWVGADDYKSDTPYGLKITHVEAIDETGFVFQIEGSYKSGFDDHGACARDWYPLRGYYYEPTATIAFSVAWYNEHNPSCRTTSAFSGYIHSKAEMTLKTVERYPGTPPSVPGISTWDIYFERQVGED